MSLNNTPASLRTHIAFFGRRNAGKSSLINAFSSQSLSIVSDVAGTTTDPVKKTMELLPLGPIVLIDTPGLDDEGALGQMRVERSLHVIDETDIAIVVTDASIGTGEPERYIENILKEKGIPTVKVNNKIDTVDASLSETENINVSAKTGEGIEFLKEHVAHLIDDQPKMRPIVSDLLAAGDVAVLVIPIDKSAPKGRLIMPQQLVIRDLLDNGMIPVCCVNTKLKETLLKLKEDPAIVITDSQVFKYVSDALPKDIRLTSFSILMARFKGTLEQALKGAKTIEALTDDSKVLIAEGCTHHRQCEDIGTVKLPGWIREYAGANPDFEFTSGNEFRDDLKDYDLVIHCGACMLNEKQAMHRYELAKNQGVPMTNYGVLIAYMNGILGDVLY